MTVTKETVQKLVDGSKIMVFSKSWCPYCAKTKALLKQVAQADQVRVLELDLIPDGDEYQSVLKAITGQSTVPNIFINKKHIGGNDALHALHAKNGLVPML